MIVFVDFYRGDVVGARGEAVGLAGLASVVVGKVAACDNSGFGHPLKGFGGLSS